jgi:hypothetical protein
VRERRAEVSGGHICSVDGEDNITSPERRATSRMRGQSTDGCGCSRKGQSPLPVKGSGSCSAPVAGTTCQRPGKAECKWSTVRGNAR